MENIDMEVIVRRGNDKASYKNFILFAIKEEDGHLGINVITRYEASSERAIMAVVRRMVGTIHDILNTYLKSIGYGESQNTIYKGFGFVDKNEEGK